jgi:hypothetical protein
MTRLRITPDVLPAELVLLVGKITIQAAYLDLFVGQLLGGLEGLDGITCAKKVHPLDTRIKAQKILAIINPGDGVPERGSLADLVIRAKEVLTERNLTVHAIIGHAADDDTYDNPVYIPFRGKYVGAKRPFSKDVLAEILSAIEAICTDLLEECLKRGYTTASALP